MSEYVLHCFAESGNSYKAALMLSCCDADWDARWVDFFNGEVDTPEYRKLNVMGEVPVLEHNGEIISQTGVILSYLADEFGRFGGETDAQKREILRWILFDNHKLTGYISILRFMLRFLKTGKTEVTGFLRGRINASLDVLNQHLQSNAFAIGDDVSIADFSMCGYLFYPEEYGINLEKDYLCVHEWLERIRQLPGWVYPYELMPSTSQT